MVEHRSYSLISGETSVDREIRSFGNLFWIKAWIGVDIGGTFTDVVLEHRDELYTLKLLTQLEAPENGVREGVSRVLDQASLTYDDVGLVIHGTTLATNALIERKGARTAMITTEGFRDTIEMGTESRFDQYDIFLDKPKPLVPRRWRYPVPQRLSLIHI